MACRSSSSARSKKRNERETMSAPDRYSPAVALSMRGRASPGRDGSKDNHIDTETQTNSEKIESLRTLCGPLRPPRFVILPQRAQRTAEVRRGIILCVSVSLWLTSVAVLKKAVAERVSGIARAFLRHREAARRPRRSRNACLSVALWIASSAFGLLAMTMQGQSEVNCFQRVSV